MFNLNPSLNTDFQCDEWSKTLSDLTGLSVKVLACVDSTNRLALSEAHGLSESSPKAWLALKQTQGRGRLGRLWQTSSKHPAFLASIAFKTKMPLSSLGILPLHVGVAIAQYLQSLGVEVGIKWPNDLVLKPPYRAYTINKTDESVQIVSKLGGILIETKQIDQDEIAVVIGVGINWYEAPVIAGRETACVAEAISQYALPSSLSSTVALLSAIHLAWKRTQQHQKCEFAAFDILAGKAITVHNKINGASHTLIQGIACGINAQGYLGIRTEQGLQWLYSGETSLSGF